MEITTIVIAVAFRQRLIPPTPLRINRRRLRPISVVQRVFQRELVDSVTIYERITNVKTMSNLQCLEDGAVVASKIDGKSWYKPRHAGVQIRRSSSLVSLEEIEKISEETKYGKWCSYLQKFPSKNVLRGSKLSLKGIVSGNLVMNEN